MKSFLISVVEGHLDIKAFGSVKDARKAMTDEYKNYRFEPYNDFEGSQWIEKNSASIDNPETGWQMHWLIVRFDELVNIQPGETIDEYNMRKRKTADIHDRIFITKKEVCTNAYDTAKQI